jgi:hypothetical protein
MSGAYLEGLWAGIALAFTFEFGVLLIRRYQRQVRQRLRALIARKQRRADAGKQGKPSWGDVLRAAGFVQVDVKSVPGQARPEGSAGVSPQSRPGWTAMLGGNRLEYGSSGFYIVFNPAANFLQQYELYTPEGAKCVHGHLLAQVQECGEHFAADRAKFQPAPHAAKTGGAA